MTGAPALNDHPVAGEVFAGAGRSRPLSPRLADHLLAAVPTLWLTLFFLAPLGFTVVYSFGRSTFGGVELDFTLDNYATALSGFYGATLLRTIVFAACASALSISVAYPVAYFIARRTQERRLLAITFVLIVSM